MSEAVKYSVDQNSHHSPPSLTLIAGIQCSRPFFLATSSSGSGIIPYLACHHFRRLCCYFWCRMRCRGSTAKEWRSAGAAAITEQGQNWVLDTTQRHAVFNLCSSFDFSIERHQIQSSCVFLLHLLFDRVFQCNESSSTGSSGSSTYVFLPILASALSSSLHRRRAANKS